MAKIISILDQKLIDQETDELEEEMTQEFLAEQYAPHFKYAIEERKATRMVHIDRKRMDYDRTNIHFLRRNKRAKRWEEVI